MSLDETTVLEEAHQLIHGDREHDYGIPRANFARIAGMWSHYLGHEVTVLDVALMMILLKAARVAPGVETTKRDTVVDIAGYAGLIERIDAC